MFRTPFTSILSGGTGTGKTKWLLKFIKNVDNMINSSPIHILYCYSEINDDIMKLKQDGVETYNGVPTKEEIQSRPKNLILILDDLVNDIKPEFLDILFTRGSHHWNVSVVLVTQNLYDKNIKTARINSHYLILMKNPQGLLQIRTLGSQLFPGNLPYFLEAYNDAVENKNYGYLIVNMQPNTEQELRLCTNVFQGDRTIIYLPN
jgi:hypothetical protein